jgi:NitT/TauT family transport system substrate-binding protein
MTIRGVTAIAAAGTMVAAAVALAGAGVGSAMRRPPTQGLAEVTLQLRSPAQAEYAGYFAAKALGYYEDFGLDVHFRPGRVGSTPEQVVANGRRAQLGVDWLPDLLAARDAGADLVNVAQMFARSGMAEVAWRSSGITSIAGLRNKRVGVWCCGNQLELYAALAKAGIDAADNRDVRIVNQPFDMRAFLAHRLDAAAGLTYDQLGDVLQTRDPRTGRPYTLRDLTVFKLQDEGTGVLEDGLVASRSWLNANRDTVMRFVAASDRGWIFCRHHVVRCAAIVLRFNPRLQRDRQLWTLNELNKLIWPNGLGIGVMDPVAFRRTASIALRYKLIRSRPSSGTYDQSVALAALRFLELRAPGIGVRGLRYRPLTVPVAPAP